MTPTKDIIANGRVYHVVEDRKIHFHVLVRGRAVDEITGLSVQDPFLLNADLPGVNTKTASDGLFGISGYPEHLTPFLPVTVTLELRSPRYRTRAVPVTIPLLPVYPVNLGDVPLRELPIRIQGRITNDTTRAPIANATVISAVSKVGILRTPLHAAHAAGAVIQRRTLTPAGPPLQLIETARSGATILNLSSTAGLAPTALLRVGPERDSDFGVISTVLTGNRVSLETPMWREFPATTVVQRHNRGAIGVSTSLARSADPGDGSVSLSGNLTGQTFELVDGPATEFGYLSALTDAQGDYRVDGVCGVPSITLKASAAGFADKQVLWPVDYGQRINYIDFRL
jgi:hypothetical protein